jgi:hypothetical protein
LGSQVIAFLRPTRRGSDWTLEEIAELYRIEHALLQARISLQTDRGVTDEGDPWFVFCRSDGEVLVHITRSDGQYYLYSSGLSSPLTGRLFTELSKSFVQQIPLQFPLRRADGVQLFVHPAAMLAIIIGTIFVASDDLCLLSDPDQARGQTDGDAAQADGGGLKMTLQGAFHKYMEGFLGSARSESSSVQSAYLNVICAIATFIVGTSVASDVDQSHSVLLAGVEASEQQPSLTHVALVSLDDSDLGWRWDDASARQQLQGNQLAETKVLVFSDNAEDTTTANSPVPSSHSEARTLGDDQFANKLHFDIGTDREKIAGGESNQLENAKSAKGDQGLTTSDVSHLISLQDSSATPPMKTVSATDSVGADRDTLAAFSVDQLLHHVFTPSTMPVAQENNLIALVSNSAADAHPISPSPLNGATAVAYPIFDATAQNTLIKFLTSNPDFKVVYNHENVIVSDGHDTGGSQPTTVQIWELQNGATIAIVGHTDTVGHV